MCSQAIKIGMIRRREPHTDRVVSTAMELTMTDQASEAAALLKRDAEFAAEASGGRDVEKNRVVLECRRRGGTTGPRSHRWPRRPA